MSFAVLIPTFRRPEGLRRALQSLLAMDRFAELACEVVVADNTPEASARLLVEETASSFPMPLRYVHAPEPGVATARNAGLQAVRDAAHVAFLDDDETAHPGWLAALAEAHLRFEADVTFGPVRGRAPTAPPRERAHVERFFSRLKTAPTGLLPDAEGCGCGNSAMRRDTALAGPEPFDVRTDHIGGEDDRLFERLRAGGARFAWAADAWVDEEVPASRANVLYLLQRAFVRGQGPPRRRLRADPPDRLGAAGWMLVGAAQFAGHGAAAAGLLAGRRASWLAQAERSAAGLGKVGWPLQLGLYGGGTAAVRAARRAGVASRTNSAVKMTQVKSL